ncbi:MAG: four-helix bundle copper-binding protein [Flavobacterium sp.]|uniref:four-helix bundle copper-binding protein n=1 Tax=Flavobacterium sp. TaxID=239 RepID=UPI00122576B4|nr:four-helix bundle copper-binding protein [Flavobacterium sp.]RZJ68504.1 MAG: four-helix bundle copper-binding protein [Flavobacterium sp.]
MTYKECISACLECVVACNHCAVSCTKEEHVHMMVKCIRLDMECAAICYGAAQLMAFESEKSGDICAICAEICDACAMECSQHDHDHCQACAEACRKCAQACRMMAA